nr:ice-binding protein [bacterium]
MPHRRSQMNRRRRFAALAAAATMVAAGLLVSTAGSASALATTVPLGTAQSFAVLAGAGITNTGPTTITGDVGTDPIDTITGAGSITLDGVYHLGDVVAETAKTDLVTAYTNAANQSDGTTDPGVDLSGQTLVAGIYGSAGVLGLTGTVTLDGAGASDGVWIFQSESTLITASSSVVSLTNGAQACNVYWVVPSSATLGTDSDFVGTILAQESITATTGVSINGRLLAQTAAVSLDSNTIIRSDCAPRSTSTVTVTDTTATTATVTDTATATGTTTATATATNH